MSIIEIKGPINLRKTTILNLIKEKLKNCLFIEVDNLIFKDKKKQFKNREEGWIEHLKRLDIVIRRATPEDALAIKKIHFKAYQKSYRGYVPDEYLNALVLDDDVVERTNQHLKTGESWLAFYKNKPAGFADVTYYDNKVFEIQALYVDPKYQKHGVGSALVSYLCKNKKETGYKKCILWTIKQGPSLVFYEKMKFRSTNEEKMWKFEIPIIKLEKDL